MRLPTNDDLLEKIPGWPNATVFETLPDYAHIAEHGGLGQLGRDLVQVEMTEHALAFQNAQIFQQATRIAFGNIISSIGLPRGTIANSVLDILGSFDPQMAAETMIKKLASTLAEALKKMTMVALTDAVEAGVGTAIDTASVVPVAGWIISICWNIGKLIHKLVQMSKHDVYDAHTLYPPSRFSPSIDRDTLNVVLAKLKTSDWTKLFYPPSVGKSESWKEAIYVNELEGGGLRFVGGSGGSDWIGFVPGTAWLHRAIEVLGSQNNKIIEVGATMLPSSQQQCLWLWNHVAKTNSPSAFTIHAESAADLWQTYIEDLRQAVRASKLSSTSKNALFGVFDRQVTKGKTFKIFGWGDGSKEVEYRPHKILNTLRKRQLAFCKTYTVAYVDPSFAALKDPAVRAAVDKYQRELLEHPTAVCNVDLGNVPDVLLAEEIRSRKKGHKCLVGGSGSFTMTTENPPDIMDGFAMPLDHPEPVARSRGPSGLQVAGAAAAAAGIVALLRR